MSRFRSFHAVRSSHERSVTSGLKYCSARSGMSESLLSDRTDKRGVGFRDFLCHVTDKVPSHSTDRSVKHQPQILTES